MQPGYVPPSAALTPSVLEPEAVRVVADAVLRPGDTLIVRVAPTHQQALEEHRRRIREQLPGVWVVVIGADQLLVSRSNPDIAGFMIGVTCMLVVLLAGWPWWTGLIAAVVVSFGWALFYLRAQVRWLWQNRHRHGWNQPPHKVEVVETSLVDRRESRGDGTGITSPRIRTPVEETGRFTADRAGWYQFTGRFTLPEPPSDDPKADPHDL